MYFGRRRRSVSVVSLVALGTIAASLVLAPVPAEAGTLTLPAMTGTITVKGGGVTATGTLNGRWSESSNGPGTRYSESYRVSWDVQVNLDVTVGCLRKTASTSRSVTGTLTTRWDSTNTWTFAPDLVASWPETWASTGSSCGQLNLVVPQTFGPSGVGDRPRARFDGVPLTTGSFGGTSKLGGASAAIRCVNGGGPGTGCFEIMNPIGDALNGGFDVSVSLSRFLTPLVPPTWDWSVPPTLNAGSDGNLDYVMPEASPDEIDPPNKPITVTACGGAPGLKFTWSIENVVRPTTTACTSTYPTTGPQYGDTKIGLTVTDALGAAAMSPGAIVRPKSYLVASLGDSYGSGEGAPQPGGTQWMDQRCHRSSLAGAAQAAAQLEASSDKSSVVFVQLACSGATALPRAPKVSPASGGLLAPYEGVDPSGPGSVRPPQVQRMREILNQTGRLTPERVKEVIPIISIGGNDVGFSDVVTDCLVFTCPSSTSLTTKAAADFAALPGRLSQVRDCITGSSCSALGITGMSVPAANVYVTTYPNITGQTPTSSCSYDAGADLLSVSGVSLANYLGYLALQLALGAIDVHLLTMTGGELAWVRDNLLNPLNTTIGSVWSSSNVVAFGSQWLPHGICSSDRWVNQFGEAFLAQGVVGAIPVGAVHPNAKGHLFGYAADIVTKFRGNGLMP